MPLNSKEYAAKYYREHMDYFKAHRQRSVAEVSELLRATREQPCADCGQQYPWYVMEFDHVRGEKKFNIGGAHGVGIKKLATEIEKCEIVCANCHRARTHHSGCLRRGGKKAVK